MVVLVDVDVVSADVLLLAGLHPIEKYKVVVNDVEPVLRCYSTECLSASFSLRKKPGAITRSGLETGIIFIHVKK